jgi:hypothetical protein
MTDSPKKRLGQYFSGVKVAELLISLCAPSKGDYIIDPMAGIGDMLSAAISVGIAPENVSGIEIDPEAGKRCKEQIAPGSVYIGDAFSLKPYHALERTSWDCVITNPPYVRYQSINGFESAGIRLQSAKDTRRSLGEVISGLSHLDGDEKACFLNLIKHYSGLSDLAVPAWILCAALTAEGGQLAMVVPESWISRDYALAVKYMLLRFFDIKYIVEDLNSVWFPEALVKTNLLIAKRVKMRLSFHELGDSEYQHIRLGSGLIGESSLVENLRYGDEKGFSALRNLLATDANKVCENYEIKRVPLESFYAEFASSQVFRKLLQKLSSRESKATYYVPKELQDVFGEAILSSALVGLDAWGFQVGQGLRTGANKFFYAELSNSKDGTDYLLSDKSFGHVPIPVSQKYSLPAFRYQSDIGDGLVVRKEMLTHRLIFISEDFYTKEGALTDSFDTPLEMHIKRAESMTFERGGHVVHFQDMSAVKPNIRIVDGQIRRYWFMLPTLASRHKPQLCISRVNYKSMKCCLMEDEDVVVDANFSTLWINDNNERTVYAMFALLNSTWTKSYLETISTVMGGGALKIEATHLRNLLLPAPTAEMIESLYVLGKNLAESRYTERSSILSEVDHVILRALLNISDVEKQYAALSDYLQVKIRARER